MPVVDVHTEDNVHTFWCPKSMPYVGRHGELVLETDKGPRVYAAGEWTAYGAVRNFMERCFSCDHQERYHTSTGCEYPIKKGDEWYDVMCTCGVPGHSEVRSMIEIDEDKIRCRVCREWTTCTRSRPYVPDAVYLMCDKCWIDYTRAHKMCRHCGEKQ